MSVAFRHTAPFVPITDEPALWVAALDYMEREYAFADGDRVGFTVWVECVANAWELEWPTDAEFARAAEQRAQMSDDMVCWVLAEADKERGPSA